MENIDKQSDPITTNQVIVIVETAKEQVKLKNKNKKAYNVKAATALGIVHIICGFITLSAEIAVNYSFGIFAPGIFASLLFLLSGGLTIFGARYCRKCLVVASMVTAITSAIAGGNLLIISASNLAYQQYYEYSPVPFALLVVMGTTMLIVAIISASLTCLPLCCRPKKQGIVHYKPNQVPDNVLCLFL